LKSLSLVDGKIAEANVDLKETYDNRFVVNGR